MVGLTVPLKRDEVGVVELSVDVGPNSLLEAFTSHCRLC